MSEDEELKRQAQRERTRFTKLRHLEEETPTRPAETGSRPFPWTIVIAVAAIGLFFARSLMKPSPPAPRPLVVAPVPTATPDPYERERVTDESVKEMLQKVNGAPSGPQPVSPPSGSNGVYHYSGPATAVDMPEMVKVRGEWMRKRSDNIYNVRGEVIYQDDKRKDRK